MRLYQILFLLFLFSCQNKTTKTIDFSVFEIQVPNSWEKIKLKGIDSNVGAIITSENDTIFYDYGYYSNDLSENPIIIDEKMSTFFKDNNKDYDKSEFIIVKNLDSINIENYKLNKEIRAVIANRNCKIVSPKKIGDGMTGIYFDNVTKSSTEKIKFNLVAYNLNEENNKLLLEAFKSIKFK